jgi:hypothetical protein
LDGRNELLRKLKLELAKSFAVKREEAWKRAGEGHVHQHELPRGV